MQIKETGKNVLKKMNPRKKVIKDKIGKPPGTLTYFGEKQDVVSKITYVEYNEEEFRKLEFTSIDGLKKYIAESSGSKVRWIDLCGLNDVSLLGSIGELFNVHKLFLEDILNSYQRPKIEISNDGIFAVIKQVNIDESSKIILDQLSIILTNNTILTFHDEADITFDIIYDRIETGNAVFKKSAADYLFYVLTDFMVDRYFLTLEELNEQIEELQEKLLEDPEKEDLSKIQALKKDVQKARQSLFPLREAVNSLIRRDSAVITDETIVYLRDTYDHVIQLIEMLETTREAILTLMDIYLSSISNKMNEVMKVLTIIATIFIPLTFIAGVYGMNFEVMPELHWEYGYFVVWVIMLVVGIFLGLFFKKKKWL